MAKAAFDKTQINGAVWHPTDKVLDVSTPHALSQAAGYLKFANGIDGGVYFRGQCAVHSTMVPSLFRGLKRVLTTRETHLHQFMTAAVQNGAFLPNTPDYAREPLLQHYGIRTRWLDLFDNVWTALWLGCNRAMATGRFGEYLHYIPNDSQHADRRHEVGKGEISAGNEKSK
jgi:hypothetical protein